MPKKRYTPQADHQLFKRSRGAYKPGYNTVAQAARHLGITEQAYYRWRKEYGGIRINQAKRLKELEKENAQLKKLVADQALDLSILKDVAEGNL